MPMNEIIRQRRKALGLTQEKVADALGVTAPAVNKWEKGTTWPDLTLVAPLARLLEVDVNTLLCFREELTTQEIGLFLNRVHETIQTAGLSEGFALGMEKVREYPGSMVLFHSLALLLDGAVKLSGLDGEAQKPYEEQVMALYRQVAEGDGDPRSRDHAIHMLASKYMAQEDYVRARALLERLPDRAALDKQSLQAALLVREGELAQAGELLERKLLAAVNDAQSTLYALLDLALKEGETAWADQLSEVSAQMVGLFSLWPYGAYVGPLQAAMTRRDVPAALAVLRPMLEALLEPWRPGESGLFRHLKFGGEEETSIDQGRQFLPMLLSELKGPEYDFLRKEPEFQALLEEWRSKCGEGRA